MKRYILPIAAIAAMIMPAMAQNTYYYYYDTPITLVEDTTRFVVFSPSVNIAPASVSSLCGTLIDSNTNERFSMQVYSRDPAMPMSKVKSQLSEIQSVQVKPCYITEYGGRAIPTPYLNVKLNNLSDYSVLVSVAKQFDCEIISQDPFMPEWYTLCALEKADYNSIEIANRIFETGLFATSYASMCTNTIQRISYDPNSGSQWGLYNASNPKIDINASFAWNYSTGKGIKIAIIDTGIDMTHPDLMDNIYPSSYDALTRKEPSIISHPHATHCAGIAAAVRNNDYAIAGVAPDSKLISISFPFGMAVPDDYISYGINWAWQNGADVISCSWRCGKNTKISEAIKNAVQNGRDGKGCVIVAAAGNYDPKHGKYEVSYPATLKNVIAVTSIESDGSFSNWSCYGSNVFVSAPGSDIISTYPGGLTYSNDGTSMAAPFVSGVAALILQRNPSLNMEEVKKIIGESATKIGNIPFAIRSDKKYGGWNEKYGYGLVNAQRAMELTPISAE